MTVDPVSQYLRLFRTRSVATGLVRAGGSWNLAIAPPQGFKFWGVTRGAAWYRFEGGPPQPLTEGDCLMLARAGRLEIATDFSAPPSGLEDVLAGRLEAGRSAPWFEMIGGEVRLEAEGVGVFLEAFGPLLRVPAGSEGSSALATILRALVDEGAGRRPGAEVASAHWAELLFVHLLRSRFAQGERPTASWLAALADPKLAPALGAMHEHPERSWTLASLAREGAQSRSGFAARFTAVVGLSPLAYLTRWRMLLARRALNDGEETLASLAPRLGYGSESAFSVAFKRETGLSPRDYRRSTEFIT